ncbi:putative Glutamic acid alanine rich protein of Trypanosoma [Trypanosoma vivax]|nr:putative Glutamic acid alanine rich protein of Trypanosoma [Trypanosoma vivax]
MDEVAASSAPEDTREAARSCVGPAANVSSDSLDEVWNAAAEVLGGDALDFLTARVSGLVGGLRELEAAAVTAEGAEADGKAASEGSCSAMSLVVASAALLLAAACEHCDSARHARSATRGRVTPHAMVCVPACENGRCGPCVFRCSAALLLFLFRAPLVSPPPLCTLLLHSTPYQYQYQYQYQYPCPTPLPRRAAPWPRSVVECCVAAPAQR